MPDYIIIPLSGDSYVTLHKKDCPNVHATTQHGKGNRKHFKTRTRAINYFF